MDPFQYNVPLNGYGALRYNPQMPGLAPVGMGPGSIPGSILPNGQIPITAPNLVNGQDAYTAHMTRQFGNIDYNHIMGTQMLEGVGAYFRGQNQHRDFLNYNRTQNNPLKMIPQNPNTSQQSLYGEQGFKSGGLTSSKAKEMLRDGAANGKKLTAQQKRYFGYIAGGGNPKMASGGDPEINAKNVAASKDSGIDDAFRIDKINSILAGTNKRISGYNDPAMDSLATQAYLWRQQDPTRSPEQLIQSFYGRDTGNSPENLLRLKLRSMNPNAMYNSTPDQTVRSFAEGGDIDPDEFDAEDFEDLKDELDRYFKDKGSAPAAQAEPEVEQGDEKEQTEQPNTQGPRGGMSALDFLMQDDNEDFDKEDLEEPNNNGTPPTSSPAPKGPLSNNTYSSSLDSTFGPGSSGSMMPDMSSHPLLQSFKNGIAKVENAGYSEGNKNSTAFGKYQFTGPTLEAVREMQFNNIPKKDFVNTYKTDPQFQERVMDAYGMHLLNQYGGDMHKAALAFYLGPGKANYETQPSYRPTPNNMTVGAYLKTFDSGYRKKMGGHIMNSPGHIDLPLDPAMKMQSGGYFEEGGEYELSDAQIALLRHQGYKIDII